MIDIQAKINEAVNAMVALAHQTNDLFKSEWEARKDIAKTLISLSSATLVFTITFSQSVIKPDTPYHWRYAILVCWLSFVLSLVCALASLWFSMTLSSLPLLMEMQTDKLKEAAKKALATADPAPLSAVSLEPFTKVTQQENKALWLLRLSALFYGLALSVFVILGVRQLFN
jgi:hypothetical protein